MRYLTLLIALGVVSCGGDTDDGPATRADDSTADAGASDDDASDDDASDDDASDDDEQGFVVPDLEDLDPPGPLLPDVDPNTEVSELTEEEFETLCEPLVDNTTHAAGSVSHLCAFWGLNAAQDSEAASEEEYRTACINARNECEASTVALDAAADAAECGAQAECTATVAELDACNTSLVLADQALLTPAADWPIPDCEDLTQATGASVALQVSFLALAAAIQIGINTEDVGENACAVIEEKCPDLISVPDLGL